ncbi:MAG: multicopper oxidase domain-containing protein [Armatimonadetes bacterium]|nr:multicopper oxidase domain-containing protein [Armatimonadota bacterium]
MRLVSVTLTGLLAATMVQVAVAQTFQLSSAKKQTFTATSVASAEKKATAGTVGKDKKSLSFTGKAANLVVRTGPEKDMMSFWTRGLRNPTIIVAAGSTMKVLFVNTDEDMLHNFRITGTAPPFDAKMGDRGSVGSASLPHKSGKSYTGQQLVFKVPTQKGTYYYVCTVPGHAAAGMYGKVVVN